MKSIDDLVHLMRKRASDSRRMCDACQDVERRAYPPASPAAVEKAEEALAMKLGLIRRLYVEVGNGGFGPGYGFVGVEGGYDEDGRCLVGVHQFLSSVYTDKELQWNELLPICTWGSAIWSCVKQPAKNGPICTLHEKGLNELSYNLRSWLEAWLDGVSLWREMFDFATIPVYGPNGTMVDTEIRTGAKGVPLLSFE